MRYVDCLVLSVVHNFIIFCLCAIQGRSATLDQAVLSGRSIQQWKSISDGFSAQQMTTITEQQLCAACLITLYLYQ